MRCFFLAVSVVAQALLAWAATPADWRSRSIYFVVTDRFARTDGSLTAPCNVTAQQYCGGSWQGLINKLDYIKNMGFTAVWITPITHNVEVQNGAQAFHGYWQDDLYTINEHYGTESDLQALSAALHSRGMYLMVDVVANHFGYVSPTASGVVYQSLTPFNNSQYFHPPCSIDYSNQTSIELCWIGYNTAVELVDVNTTRQDVKDTYHSWINGLVAKYSVDGLRVDTVKHVQKDFWPGFESASGVYNVGEVFSGNTGYVCDYQNYMSGLLNYPLWYTLTAAFKSTSGSMTNLVNSVNKIKATCKNSTLLAPFLENHDNPRFPSLTSDVAQAKNAIAFALLADGIPILYYGQEQHLSGGNDPNNREALWLTGYNTSTELYQAIASINQIRNVAINKDKKYLDYKAYPIYSDTTTIAMRKGYNDSCIVGVFSNKGSAGANYTQVIRNTGFSAGSVVVEILTCTKVTVGTSGSLTVAMGKGQPRIFYPTSKLAGTGVCKLSTSDGSSNGTNTQKGHVRAAIVFAVLLGPLVYWMVAC